MGRVAPPALDQTTLPPVYLTRTGSRANFADTEFFGLHSMFNASPVGIWNVSMSRVSTQRVPLSEIEDIELKIALAGRAISGDVIMCLDLPPFDDNF